jgi:hypothetical protein
VWKRAQAIALSREDALALYRTFLLIPPREMDAPALEQ